MRPCLGSVGKPLGTAASVAAFALAGVLAGCGGAPPGGRPAATSGVEVRDSNGRPRLGLVVREGDPFGGVAVAITHDLGATASVWLAELLADRVKVEVPELRAPRPSGSGLTLSAAVPGAAGAERFVRAVDAALSRPFSADDLARHTGTRLIPPVAVWKTRAEAATSACAGELGEAAPRATPSLAELDRFREAVRSASGVAFSAVGSRELAERTATALATTPKWPDGRAVQDPWPPADVHGVTQAIGDAPALTVALRLGDANAALGAAATLGARRSLLAEHLRALAPSWTVDRVVGVTRPRGACLRLDLHASGAASVAASAEVAALVVDEANRATVGSGAGGRADPGVLGQADPRDAAETAAWRALSGRLEGGAPRTFINLSTKESEPALGFSALVAEATQARKRPSVETRVAREAGQGETWMLLGSPCATAAETSDTAGAAALSARAIATVVPELDGVTIEPWVSSEGIGLLAHAPARHAETPGDQAARIASALGRAITETPLSDSATALARAAQSDELSSESIPLWPVVLDALSPRRPSLLDPRGTFQSVTELSTPAIEAARRGLSVLPLRLAVLASDDRPDTQRTIAVALERHLRPGRSGTGVCPEVPPLAPKTGMYEVTIPDTNGAPSRAVVAVALPRPGDNRAEAEQTARLLNRPGGYLDSAIRVPGLAVFAEASVIGGSESAALAIEITTTNKKAPDAVAQVRALLSRLAEGAASTDDLAALGPDVGSGAERAADPRRRVVNLWLGRAAPKTPDVVALRRFQRAVLGAERHVVVVAKPR